MQHVRKQYPVVLEQDVIWRDLDAFQHVNNAVYFRYFEDARMSYFARTGILDHKQQTGIGPILASTKCDFRIPLSFPDRVLIATTVKNLKEKRFTMQYFVYSENVGELAAEGEGLIVYYDYTAGHSCPVPQNIAKAIADVERDTEQTV